MKAIPFAFIVVLININAAHGQDKNIKAGLMVMPIFQGGALLANGGFEYQDNDNSSWQLGISYGASQVGADANATTRTWITVDRTYYLKKEKPLRKRAFFSLFVEAGSRKIAPGHIHIDGNTMIKKWNAKEICPGIAIGKNFSIGQKLHLQVLGGPKAILAFHNDQYYKPSTNSNFHTKYNDMKAGFRFLLNLCYSL